MPFYDGLSTIKLCLALSLVWPALGRRSTNHGPDTLAPLLDVLLEELEDAVQGVRPDADTHALERGAYTRCKRA